MSASARSHQAPFGVRLLLLGYRAAWALLAPVVVLVMLIRAKQLGKQFADMSFSQRFMARLGLGFEPVTATPRVWVHAVSMGEVNSAKALIQTLLDSGVLVVLTTQTNTGFAAAKRLFGGSINVQPALVDAGFAVSRFVAHYHVKAQIVIEAEVWPGTLTKLHKLGVPVAFANARMSERSYNGFKKFAALSRYVFGTLTRVCTQDQLSAQRLINLGASSKRVSAHANLKFANLTAAHVASNKAGWFVAASTHESEEQACLSAFHKLKELNPSATLIIVPRHPERFEVVAEFLTSAKVDFKQRSKGELPEAGTVFLADSLGELERWYALAWAAFVGGSLVPVGGHNPLEAVAQGAVVLMGPHTHKCAEVVDLLKQQQAFIEVADSDQLAEQLITLIQNPVLSEGMQWRGLQLVNSAQAQAQVQVGQLLEFVNQAFSANS